MAYMLLPCAHPASMTPGILLACPRSSAVPARNALHVSLQSACCTACLSRVSASRPCPSGVSEPTMRRSDTKADGDAEFDGGCEWGFELG
eukprot:3089002-Rhodomonas_salina.1